MSVRPDKREGVTSGIELACDHYRCRHTFHRVGRIGRYPSLLRAAASIVGWTVRPTGGPGARTAPDFCCDHKPKPP